MRHLASLLIIIALPPILAGLISYPFDARAYVFIAAFISFTIISLPYASAVADGRALGGAWRTGAQWLAWYVVAAAGFSALILIMLLID